MGPLKETVAKVHAVRAGGQRGHESQRPDGAVGTDPAAIDRRVVDALSAVEPIDAIGAGQAIVAGSTEQGVPVIAQRAEQPVQQHIVPVPSREKVVAAASEDGVVARLALETHRLRQRPSIESIIARTPKSHGVGRQLGADQVGIQMIRNEMKRRCFTERQTSKSRAACDRGHLLTVSGRVMCADDVEGCYSVVDNLDDIGPMITGYH